MIGPEQIRAARALLDWSTADLAKQTGLTVNGINKIERGHVNPHRDTLTKIQDIFEDAGIEFLANSGVRKKDRMIQAVEGPEANQWLLDDVYSTMKNEGGEVLIAHVITKVQEQGFPYGVKQEGLERHLQRLTKAGIKERLLIKEGETNFTAPLESHHMMPDKYFAPDPLYIYGSKIALLSAYFAPKAVIINDARFAESVRGLFNFAWDRTKAPAGKAKK